MERSPSGSAPHPQSSVSFQPRFSSFPLPLSHLYPLIPLLSCESKKKKKLANSRPFFGDIWELFSRSQLLLRQFQSACWFEGAARCFWLHHMSSDTVSWGCGGAAWVGEEGAKDEAIWIHLWEPFCLKLTWLTCGKEKKRNTTATHQN